MSSAPSKPTSNHRNSSEWVPTTNTSNKSILSTKSKLYVCGLLIWKLKKRDVSYAKNGNDTFLFKHLL